MREFEITIKIKNNLIKERREALDMSPREFAKACGISYQALLDYEGLRRSPVSKGHWKRPNDNLDWKNSALAIAQYLGEHPHALWPEAVQSIVKNTVVKKMDALDVGLLSGQCEGVCHALPPIAQDDSVDKAKLSSALADAVGGLSYQEKQVIKWRFTDGLTFRQCGERWGLSRTRIMQIEARALRKLRHPKIANQVRELAGYDLCD